MRPIWLAARVGSSSATSALGTTFKILAGVWAEATGLASVQAARRARCQRGMDVSAIVVGANVAGGRGGVHVSQDFAWIRERIDAVPRVRLGLTPTPLQEAPNLSRALGGPRILIKRDDLTGVAFGGNKLRNLEFRLA